MAASWWKVQLLVGFLVGLFLAHVVVPAIRDNYSYQASKRSQGQLPATLGSSTFQTWKNVVTSESARNVSIWGDVEPLKSSTDSGFVVRDTPLPPRIDWPDICRHLSPSNSSNTATTSESQRISDSYMLPFRKWIYPLTFWEEQGMVSSAASRKRRICPSLKKNLEHVVDAYLIWNRTWNETVGKGDTNDFSTSKAPTQTANGSTVYYHLHKVGGTTMFHSKPSHGGIERTHLKDRSRYPTFKADAKLMLQRLAKDPTSVLFTFLRDPVTRFLSGLGQIIRMPRRKCLYPCLEIAENSQELIDCVLDKIEGVRIDINGTSDSSDQQSRPVSYDYLDTHLVPQSIELLSGIQGLNISVMVMPLSDIDVVLDACGMDHEARPMRSITHRNTNATVDQPIPPRQAKYPMDPDLVLTPVIRQRICKVYDWDVQMLKKLGGLIPSQCG